ncbi:MAG: RecX family transcriptional regulator [Flavobacteriaceae bacterium]|nr:RecX family transcriptional regulator [Flavobacteriaceae bacterium]
MKNKKLTYTLEEAKKRLERYCIYQDRCHKEIEQKLYEMRMIPEACEVIILHLLEHDFLNEERFSKSFTRGKFRIKSWGKQRIIRELKKRDISKYNIDLALKEISDDDYFEKLNEIAIKRLDGITESNSYKKNQKLVNFLLYKGFESYLVYEKVKEISKH